MAGAAAAVAEAVVTDRVGIGWRPQLSAGILASLDQIDIVEVIADDYFDASSAKVRSLSTLASQVPITLHGVGQGMASTVAADKRRLQSIARLVNKLEPEAWSEHFAFVRAADMEIGHLAAPPRNAQSIEGTLQNLHHARRIVGTLPQMENVATFVDPPGSTLTEDEWLSAVASQSGCELLLDLQNVYTNGVNTGYDPLAMLAALPLEQVGSIHIAGGKWLDGRILDDHLHDVPDPVYELLRYVASHTHRPLTVVLERDGSYPPMALLLEQLDKARGAIEIGRCEAEDAVTETIFMAQQKAAEILSTPQFEQILVSIYLDPKLLDSPAYFAQSGLSDQQTAALLAIDKKGLRMAAHSFAHKRASKQSPQKSFWSRIKRRFS